MRLDLHLHTTASDGAWSPERLRDEALRRQLVAWSITDHDTLAGWRSVADSPGLVTGVEVSTRLDEHEIHVVGLGFDPEHPALAAMLAANVAERRRRAEVILAHVAERTGVVLSLDDCTGEGEMVIRSHIAAALVARGVVTHPQEAFRDLLADTTVRKLYTPAYPTPTAAATALHASGGVALLAHPGLYRDIHLIERAMAGLDGLETNHPHLDPALKGLLESRVAARGWLESAGSDFHREPCRLGDWRLSRARARPLLERVGLW